MLKKFFRFIKKEEEDKCELKEKIDFQEGMKFCFNYSFDASIIDVGYINKVSIYLKIECEELDINVDDSLMYKAYNELQTEDLENILSMTEEEIEEIIVIKARGIMEEKSKVEKIEILVEKINGKKGELHIKINGKKIVDKQLIIIV